MTLIQMVQERRGGSGQVLLLRLNRPESANAYSEAMLGELGQLLDGARRDPSIRAAVITGVGKVFCAGADLTELHQRNERDGLLLAAREVFDRWADAPWPTVAAVNGPAVGGGFELALASDLCVCSSGASFRLPEVGLGLLPGAGGIRRLVAAVGACRTRQLALFRRILDAEMALAWGLVSQIHEAPVELAVELAEAAATADPMALTIVKALIQDQAETLRGRGAETAVQALLYGRRQRSQTTR